MPIGYAPFTFHGWLVIVCILATVSVLLVRKPFRMVPNASMRQRQLDANYLQAGVAFVCCFSGLLGLFDQFTPREVATWIGDLFVSEFGYGPLVGMAYLAGLIVSLVLGGVLMVWLLANLQYLFAQDGSDSVGNAARGQR